MSNESTYKDIDIQLELKDRINYSFILQTTILYIKRMMSKSDLDADKIEDMMWDFLTDIPKAWEDKEFIEDVKKSFRKAIVDIRPLWGEDRISVETCKEMNIPTEKEIVKLNPYMLKKAIINLLHRRDMLVRKKKIEFSTGKNLDVKTLDDLAVYDEDTNDNIKDSTDEKIKAEIEEIEKENKENISES